MYTFTELENVSTLPSALDPGAFDAWEKHYLGIDRKNKQVLIPCYLAIFSIHAALNSSKIPLTRLTKNYLQRVLLPVTTTLYKDLDSYRGSDSSAASVKNNIRSARVHLNTALDYFDSKKYKKYKHLSEAEVEFGKALKYFYKIREDIEEGYPALLD